MKGLIMKRFALCVMFMAAVGFGSQAMAQDYKNGNNENRKFQNDGQRPEFNGDFKPCPCCMKDMKKDGKNNGKNNRPDMNNMQNGDKNFSKDMQNMGRNGQRPDGQNSGTQSQKRDFPKCKCSKNCKKCDCNKTSSKKSKKNKKNKD